MTIVGYIIVLGIVLFGLHMLIMGPVGTLIGGISGIPLLGMFIGALFTWMIINIGWLFIYGEQMPLLLFLMAYLLIQFHPQKKNFTTEDMHQVLNGERIAIFVVAIYTIFKSNSINWF